MQREIAPSSENLCFAFNRNEAAADREPRTPHVADEISNRLWRTGPRFGVTLPWHYVRARSPLRSSPMPGCHSLQTPYGS